MTIKTITLAGKQYPIPDLSVKQLSEIDWRLLRSAGALADRTKFTQQVRDDLFDITYFAVTKATPMTREEFDAMDVSLLDIINSMPVIVTQTHMFKPATEAAPTTGEAAPTGQE